MIPKTFTIQTPHSILIARQILMSRVEESSTSSTNNVYYASLQGRVSESGFKLSRVYGGGAPITTIRGRFEEISGGTAIFVRMNPTPGAIVFVLFFAMSLYHPTAKQTSEVIAQLNLFQLDVASIFNFLSSAISLLLPIGLPVLMVSLGWRSELEFYQKRLTQIFAGMEV
jgi:hypothetical protein